MDLTTFMSWPQAVGKGVPLTTKKGGFAGARAVAAPVLPDAHQPSLSKSDLLIIVQLSPTGFVKYPRTKPMIAAVDGAALAGGCEIVLACAHAPRHHRDAPLPAHPLSP